MNNFFSWYSVSEVILTAFDKFCTDKDDFFLKLELIILVDFTKIFENGYNTLCKNVNGIAIISETSNGFRFAYVFGITSPNNKIKKVVKKIWNIKLKVGLWAGR